MVRAAGTWAMILMGNAILAFGVTAFIAPHGIITAGTTGIVLALARFLSLDTAAVVPVLNLLTELQAGVTVLLMETGCAGREGKGVLCVIPPRKLYVAKELVYAVDIKNRQDKGNSSDLFVYVSHCQGKSSEI